MRDLDYVAEQADYDDGPGIALHSVSCRDSDCPAWQGVGECMDDGEYEVTADD